MCTDEFVISRKGTALTLEAGQKGKDPYQVGLGFKIALNAIAHVSKQTLEISLPQRNSEITSSQLYKIDHSQTPEDHRGLTLDPGWKNFHQVKKGRTLSNAKTKSTKHLDWKNSISKILRVSKESFSYGRNVSNHSLYR